MFQTPLSIGAGGSSGTLADKAIVRDGWGRPIIPASHLKGKARHAAEALARALGQTVAELWAPERDPSCPIQRIFGGPGAGPAPQGYSGRPDISPLRFRDLQLEGDFDAIDDSLGLRRGVIRPSVAINRRRGVADDQRLLFQETTVETLVFSRADAIVGQLAEQRDLALLLVALRLIDRWGGAKSRGLGWAAVEAQAYWDGAQFAVTPENLEQHLLAWEVPA
jgi:CRISPR/Cas system CSM-associated protein Csm3 (group 7 of RAMP superfamily)